MIGKVERIALRDVWRNEARNFTTWLADNLDILSETIGIQFTLVETEKSVGPFNVDILAEDPSGNSIIIENQLEKTDHDHLGKVLTYTVNLDAKKAIWIAAETRQEHITAISWLNEYTPLDFYLLKVEAIKIGNSEPAPLFNIISGPSEESKNLGTDKKALSSRHEKRIRFWETLLELSKTKTTLFSNVSPKSVHWISSGIGLSGLSLNYIITQDSGGIELTIDKGKGFKELNKKMFDFLLSKKEEIESNLGDILEWNRLDDKQSSIIRKRFYGTGLIHEDNWSEIQHRMIDFMIKFEKTFKKYISNLKSIDI